MRYRTHFQLAALRPHREGRPARLAGLRSRRYALTVKDGLQGWRGYANRRGTWCTPGRSVVRLSPYRGHLARNRGWDALSPQKSPISWLADANLSLRAPKVAAVAGRTPSSRFDSANARVSTTPSPARKRSCGPCGPLPRHCASQLRGALATKIGDFSGLAPEDVSLVTRLGCKDDGASGPSGSWRTPMRRAGARRPPSREAGRRRCRVSRGGGGRGR